MKQVAKTESCACHLCLTKAHNFPEECAISIIGEKNASQWCVPHIRHKVRGHVLISLLSLFSKSYSYTFSVSVLLSLT